MHKVLKTVHGTLYARHKNLIISLFVHICPFLIFKNSYCHRLVITLSQTSIGPQIYIWNHWSKSPTVACDTIQDNSTRELD